MLNFLKQIFAEFSKNQCSTLAAALAFYTAFALPPLLYLLLTILTFGMSVMYDSEQAGAKAESALKSQAAQVIGNPSASEAIATILDNNHKDGGKWWKTLISLAVIGDQVGNVIGFSGAIASFIDFSVQAVVVLLTFAAIFKFMPDAVVTWRDALVGAIVTTVLFLVGRFAMQVYFSYSAPGAQLGSAAASLAVLLMWIYYTAMIVLLGAEVTQVYAVCCGAGIQPEKGAVRVVREIKYPST